MSNKNNIFIIIIVIIFVIAFVVAWPVDASNKPTTQPPTVSIEPKVIKPITADRQNTFNKVDKNNSTQPVQGQPETNNQNTTNKIPKAIEPSEDNKDDEEDD